MEITIDMIKALRQQTGAGILDCKNALEQSKGDATKAQEILKAKGFRSAVKVANRETREGVVEAYIHSGSRIGAMVEINCETDFVARTPEVRELAHLLAMQVAAMSPLYIDVKEMGEGESRPPEEICLLEQPYIKDNSRKVNEVIQEAIAKVGENIRVRRFARFALGE